MQVLKEEVLEAHRWWDLLEQLGMEKKAENSFIQLYPSLEVALPLNP